MDDALTVARSQQQNPRLLEWSIAQQDSSLSSLSKKTPMLKPVYGGLSWSSRMKAKNAQKPSKRISLARLGDQIDQLSTINTDLIIKKMLFY